MNLLTLVFLLVMPQLVLACGPEEAHDPQAFLYTGQWAYESDTNGWNSSSNQSEYLGGFYTNNTRGRAQKITLDRQTNINQIFVDMNTDKINSIDEGSLDFNFKLYTKSAVTPWTSGLASVPDTNSLAAVSNNVHTEVHEHNSSFTGIYTNYSVSMSVSLPPGDYWLSEEWLGGIVTHIDNVRYS